QSAALHPACVSAPFAFASTPHDRSRAISETLRGRRRVDLSRRCFLRRACSRAIFAGRAALPTIARISAAGNGIRGRRFPGAKFGVVLSIADQRLDGAVKFSERGTIHGEKRSALCHFADDGGYNSISAAARDVDKLCHARL